MILTTHLVANTSQGWMYIGRRIPTLTIERFECSCMTLEQNEKTAVNVSFLPDVLMTD